MPSDDSTAHLGKQLDRLIAITDQYLQTIKRLERDNRTNLRVRAALEKKKNPSASLTSEEEALIGGKSDQTFIDEWARIGHERHEIAKDVRSNLRDEAWTLLPDLEIDFPKTRGFRQGFEALIGEIPEDPTESVWVTEFLMGLDTLLRDAGEKVRNAPPPPAPVVAATVANVPDRAVGPTRRRGPAPAMEKHRKIAEAVRPHLPNWKDESALEAIAEELDREKVPISKAWSTWDPKPRSWDRAVEYHPDRVIKAIDYSLKKCVGK